MSILMQMLAHKTQPPLGNDFHWGFVSESIREQQKHFLNIGNGLEDQQIPLEHKPHLPVLVTELCLLCLVYNQLELLSLLHFIGISLGKPL